MSVTLPSGETQAHTAQRTQATDSARPQQASGGARSRSRKHLHELDLIRIVTALGVVGVHVAYYTVFLNTTSAGAAIQHGVESSLHFTREIFMFTTAFVLVYAYYGKPFALGTFWRKRGIGVVLPYIAWTILYVWLSAPQQSLGRLAGTSALDTLNGNASYQLYYILLTIEFYLIFPLFLRILPFLDRHRWKAIAVSGLLELALMAVDYHTVQTPSVVTTPVGTFLTQFQDRFVLVYQFYFVLGGLAALHLSTLRMWVLRHGKLLVGGFALAFAGFWGHYLLAIGPLGEPVTYAKSVLQPVMVIYSVAVLGFLGWLACRWAGTRTAAGVPHGARTWQTLADAAFGVYLIHPLFLTAALQYLVPNLPGAWPVALRVALVWAFTAGCTIALSVALMRTPLLSRLVGRSVPVPPRIVAAGRQAWRWSLRFARANTKPRTGATGPGYRGGIDVAPGIAGRVHTHGLPAGLARAADEDARLQHRHDR